MLFQVQQDRGRFKDRKVGARAVDDDRYLPVGVQLEVPWLLLHVLGDADFLQARIVDQRSWGAL